MNDIIDDLDEDNLNSEENSQFDPQLLDGEYERMGNEGEKVVEQMMEMDNIIKNSGWLDDSLDGIPGIDLTVVQPQVLQPASKWDAAAENARQHYINEKSQNIPAHPNKDKKSVSYMLDNDVKIVDKSYLLKTFKPNDQKSQDLTNDTTRKFDLNSEQECAF